MENQATSIKNPLIAEAYEAIAQHYPVSWKTQYGHVRLIVDSCPSLKIELVKAKDGVIIRLWAGSADNGQQRVSQYSDFVNNWSSDPSLWRSPEETAPYSWPDSEVFADVSELVEHLTEVIEFALAVPYEKAVSFGVTFADTNFAGYGERDFMAAVVQIQKAGYATVIPGVGTNLGFEFQVPSTGSRIDAVEFDAAGSVVTVIECQSGIQSGAYLDDEHFAKAISRYPQSEEIRETVKKIVVIAGGFAPEQLATFAQLPYEIVALKTVVVDGVVVLETVA